MALAVGYLASCSDEEDEDCITCTSTYDGESETEKVCEDQESVWKADSIADNWNDYKKAVMAIDALVEEVSCK